MNRRTGPLALAVVVLLAGWAEACHRRACYIAYTPCYTHCYPSCQPHIIAASATIVVRIPEDSTLYVDGKEQKGAGLVHTITTPTIPIGKTREFKLVVLGMYPEKKSEGKTTETEKKKPEKSEDDDPGPAPPGGYRLDKTAIMSPFGYVATTFVAPKKDKE